MRLVEQSVNRPALADCAVSSYMIALQRGIKTQSFALNDSQSRKDWLVKKDLAGQKARKS
ncbi:hypothetical protein [Rhizobium sp. FY34]|uniref:hypothetical protein n=1 Tax=Rhizobium sp. FY34 TaxID=2562309 RepID=UPI0010C096CE|nr:hypothetical protein [Rhizobium sp. FY34]